MEPMKRLCSKTTTIDEQVVALLTPQFQPLSNELDSSAPYHTLDVPVAVPPPNKALVLNEDVEADLPEDVLVVIDVKDDMSVADSTPPVKPLKRPSSSVLQDIESTPKPKKLCLIEIKKRNISNITSSIIKRKSDKQTNEDLVTNKRLEVYEIQRQHELMKLEKTKVLLDLDIELKKTLLENAKLDLVFKRKNYNL